MLKIGTLNQLYASCDDRVLLSLSLPLGASCPVNTARLRYVFFISMDLLFTSHYYSDLSSDRVAWLHTNKASGFRPMIHPSDDTTWGTVGSKGAVSWIHVDDDGFCTSTQILVGKKYWVILYRDPSLPHGDLRGDMGGIGWSPSIDELQAHPLDGWFVAEAIEMTTGTLL